MLKSYLRLPLQHFAEPAPLDKPAEEKPPIEETLPKTQKELDDLIETRLARERKKQEKPPAPAVTPSTAAEQQPQDAVATTELLKVQEELLAAKGMVEAYKLGFNADTVEDAVYLAMREAQKSGEAATEESVVKALSEVAKRHPEWKSQTTKPGFKVGADGKQQQTDDEALASIFGNTTTK